MSKTNLEVWAENNKTPRVCPICEKEFMPKNPTQVYCSHECLLQGRRKRYAKYAQKGNAVKVTSSSELSDNMKKIAEMVKDDPRYGLKVAKEEGRIK